MRRILLWLHRCLLQRYIDAAMLTMRGGQLLWLLLEAFTCLQAAGVGIVACRQPVPLPHTLPCGTIQQPMHFSHGTAGCRYTWRGRFAQSGMIKAAHSLAPFTTALLGLQFERPTHTSGQWL